MEKLLLIDAYGFAFRAYHSLPPLKRPYDGAIVGAVYGFTNMLYNIIEKHDGYTHIAVVFDSGGPNFRHNIYPKYKANRKDVDEDLKRQFPMLRDAVRAFGIIGIESYGYEADDMIATYCRLGVERNIDVTIVTSDKDMMQLVKKGVTIFDPIKNKLISDEQVVEKFGVKPHLVRDILALIGDASDNVPGVKGIGIKTAQELLYEYGTLNGLYNNVAYVKQEKRRTTLMESREMAFLSYDLVGLKDDVDCEVGIDDLRYQKIDYEKIMEFVNYYGFKSIAQRILKHNPKKPSNNLIINSHEELQKFFTIMPAMISFIQKDDNFEIFINNATLLVNTPLDPKIHAFLQEIFNSPTVKKIAIDGRDLYESYGCAQNIEDVLTAGYLLFGNQFEINFENLLQQYGFDLQNSDAEALFNLYLKMRQDIDANRLNELYEGVDVFMPKIMHGMHRSGILIDREYLEQLGVEFEEKRMALEEKIFSISNYKFNLASPKQVAKFLFDDLKIPFSGKSRSTDAQVLEDIRLLSKLACGSNMQGVYGAQNRSVLNVREDSSTGTTLQVAAEVECPKKYNASYGHEVAGLILQWRHFSKLLTTYISGIKSAISGDKRVHSTFSATTTLTGRLTSTKPNLQNIPAHSEDASKIRKVFVAKDGFSIISADYSQIELRLLAHMADVPSLIEDFHNGVDIHAATARKIFNTHNISDQMRNDAKTINFSVLYGISPFSLARRLNITNELAKKYIDDYFLQYPEIKVFMDKTLDFAKSFGYIKTIYGRKCYIPNLNHKNFMQRSFAQRSAINAPLQGSAADIIKRSMARLSAKVQYYMILQIHDELLFEVPDVEVDSCLNHIKEVMENSTHISVPLSINTSVFKKWS